MTVTRNAKPDVHTPMTGHPHEATWDHHGSYQWTYFSNEVKARMKFFLSTRLNGRNVDLGGGWHLLYPNSAVVDLSTICLRQNPAEEKVHFNLDWIASGRRLPFPDASFDSATMVSVWQYLNGHDAILNEIKRILKPGGKFYLINGDGAGLQECITTSARTKEMVRFFEAAGFDTLTERIPIFANDAEIAFSQFHSICVTMPGPEGKREKPLTETRKIDPEKFTSEFVEWEMAARLELMSRVATYPITGYSERFRDATEAFSAEFEAHTNRKILVFAEHAIPQQLAMMTEEQNFYVSINFVVLHEEGYSRNNQELLRSLMEKYGVRGSSYLNYFGTDIGLLVDPSNSYVSRTTNGRDYVLEQCAKFVAAVPLTDLTESLQLQMKLALSRGGSPFSSYVDEAQSLAVGMQLHEHKGRRGIAELIEQKQRIENGTETVIAQGEYDLERFLPEIRRSVLSSVQRAD